MYKFIKSMLINPPFYIFIFFFHISTGREYESKIVKPSIKQRNSTNIYYFSLDGLKPSLKYTAFLIANYGKSSIRGHNIKFITLGFGGDANR